MFPSTLLLWGVPCSVQSGKSAMDCLEGVKNHTALLAVCRVPIEGVSLGAHKLVLDFLQCAQCQHLHLSIHTLFLMACVHHHSHRFRVCRYSMAQYWQHSFKFLGCIEGDNCHWYLWLPSHQCVPVPSSTVGMWGHLQSLHLCCAHSVMSWWDT